MELQFGMPQPPDSAVEITTEDGALIFAYDPGEDEILGENARPYRNMVISCPGFTPGDAYRIRGYVTAGTANPYNTFPGSIYLQDGSGGIEIADFTEEAGLW